MYCLAKVELIDCLLYVFGFEHNFYFCDMLYMHFVSI